MLTQRMHTNLGKQLVEDLKVARARIEDPKRWLQGLVGLYDGERCCAVIAAQGAVSLTIVVGTTESDRLDTIVDTLDRVAMSIGFNDPRGWLRPSAYLNDNSDHATVLRMFDLAIAETEAR